MGCSLLHRIALPVVLVWCQKYACTFRSTLIITCFMSFFAMHSGTIAILATIRYLTTGSIFSRLDNPLCCAPWPKVSAPYSPKTRQT